MLNEAIQITTSGQPGGGENQLSPQQQQETMNYKTVLTKIIHGKENRDNIVGMLNSYKQPELAVPEVSQMVMAQADQIMGKRAPNEFKLGLSCFVISDLIQLGNAAKIWPAVSEEEAKNIYQDTIQDAIHKGLKDKTIDPVELQQSAEPLMTPQQQEIGAAHAIKGGVPPQVDPRAVLNMQNQKRIDAAREQGKAQAQQPQQQAVPTGGK